MPMKKHFNYVRSEKNVTFYSTLKKRRKPYSIYFFDCYEIPAKIVNTYKQYHCIISYSKIFVQQIICNSDGFRELARAIIGVWYWWNLHFSLLLLNSCKCLAILSHAGKISKTHFYLEMQPHFSSKKVELNHLKLQQ